MATSAATRLFGGTRAELIPRRRRMLARLAARSASAAAAASTERRRELLRIVQCIDLLPYDADRRGVVAGALQRIEHHWRAHAHQDAVATLRWGLVGDQSRPNELEVPDDVVQPQTARTRQRGRRVSARIAHDEPHVAARRRRARADAVRDVRAVRWPRNRPHRLRVSVAR